MYELFPSYHYSHPAGYGLDFDYIKVLAISQNAVLKKFVSRRDVLTLKAIVRTKGEYCLCGRSLDAS